MTEDYFKKLRLGYALGISKQEVHRLFCNQNDIICKRMRNNIRAINKNQHNYRSNLTKDCFLHQMFNDEDVIIEDWDVQLKVGGDFEKGWNFKLKEALLYYAN
jgi:hypothetical protein